MRGIAPDGGLYVPCEIPSLHAQGGYTASAMRRRRLRCWACFWSEYAPELLLGARRRGAAPGFNRADIRPVEEGLYALDVARPYLCLQGYALQLMPRLLVEAKRILGDTRTTEILVATSGDTGKRRWQALPGCRASK